MLVTYKGGGKSCMILFILTLLILILICHTRTIEQRVRQLVSYIHVNVTQVEKQIITYAHKKVSPIYNMVRCEVKPQLMSNLK